LKERETDGSVVERVRKSGEKTELDEAVRAALIGELQSSAAPDRKGLQMSFGIAGGLAVLMMTAVAMHFFELIPWDAVGNIASALALVLVIYILKLSYDFKGYKSQAECFNRRLAALTSGEYETYSVGVTRKLWCESSLYIEEFLIECGDVNVFANKESFGISADKMIFIIINDQIIAVPNVTNLQKPSAAH
jgi:hypothetical protein